MTDIETRLAALVASLRAQVFRSTDEWGMEVVATETVEAWAREAEAILNALRVEDQ
jgi:hypothetical protein